MRRPPTVTGRQNTVERGDTRGFGPLRLLIRIGVLALVAYLVWTYFDDDAIKALVDFMRPQ